jgi:hypothetical protein
LFNSYAEIERKLSIGKMKLNIFGNFFNLASEMERNVSISGWISSPLYAGSSVMLPDAFHREVVVLQRARVELTCIENQLFLCMLWRRVWKTSFSYAPREMPQA